MLLVIILLVHNRHAQQATGNAFSSRDIFTAFLRRACLSREMHFFSSFFASSFKNLEQSRENAIDACCRFYACYCILGVYGINVYNKKNVRINEQNLACYNRDVKQLFLYCSVSIQGLSGTQLFCNVLLTVTSRFF